jgi:hypothetical protein
VVVAFGDEDGPDKPVLDSNANVSAAFGEVDDRTNLWVILAGICGLLSDLRLTRFEYDYALSL